MNKVIHESVVRTKMKVAGGGRWQLVRMSTYKCKKSDRIRKPPFFAIPKEIIDFGKDHYGRPDGLLSCRPGWELPRCYPKLAPSTRRVGRGRGGRFNNQGKVLRSLARATTRGAVSYVHLPNQKLMWRPPLGPVPYSGGLNWGQSCAGSRCAHPHTSVSGRVFPSVSGSREGKLSAHFKAQGRE